MLAKLSIRELKIDFKSFFKKMIQEKSAPFGAYTQKEMTLDLLLTQDQGSSIVDGINHLRNLLLSIDLLMESLLSTLDSLLFCIFIIQRETKLFKMGCSIRMDANSYEN